MASTQADVVEKWVEEKEVNRIAKGYPGNKQFSGKKSFSVPAKYLLSINRESLFSREKKKSFRLAKVKKSKNLNIYIYIYALYFKGIKFRGD